jgi:hypothetical protein
MANLEDQGARHARIGERAAAGSQCQAHRNSRCALLFLNKVDCDVSSQAAKAVHYLRKPELDGLKPPWFD